jgi:hypothetical protein
MHARPAARTSGDSPRCAASIVFGPEARACFRNVASETRTPSRDSSPSAMRRASSTEPTTRRCSASARSRRPAGRAFPGPSRYDCRSCVRWSSTLATATSSAGAALPCAGFTLAGSTAGAGGATGLACTGAGLDVGAGAGVGRACGRALSFGGSFAGSFASSFAGAAGAAGAGVASLVKSRPPAGSADDAPACTLRKP